MVWHTPANGEVEEGVFELKLLFHYQCRLDPMLTRGAGTTLRTDGLWTNVEENVDVQTRQISHVRHIPTAYRNPLCHTQVTHVSMCV